MPKLPREWGYFGRHIILWGAKIVPLSELTGVNLADMHAKITP